MSEVSPPFDSFLAVYRHLGLAGHPPFDPDWAAAPDFQARLVSHVLRNQPVQIVECSSGLSTLLMARCCQINGAGRVTSLENGEEYARKTRQQLKRHGLDTYAEVVDAPLESIPVDGVQYLWYALNRFQVTDIDLLVVDGPPGDLQPHSRYPALPRLGRWLSDQAVIFLDDAARGDEQEIVSRWLRQTPGLTHEYLDLERGCSILRR